MGLSCADEIEILTLAARLGGMTSLRVAPCTAGGMEHGTMGHSRA